MAVVTELVYKGDLLRDCVQGSTSESLLARAQLLQWMWTACSGLAHAAIKGWPHLLPQLQHEWCLLFLRAAEAACAMQRTWLTGVD